MGVWKIEALAQTTGVIVEEPELKRTVGTGTPVCRLMVAADVGAASIPVRKPIYVWGLKDGEADEAMADLAERCGRNLRVGDTVTATGVERHRHCRVKGQPAIEAAIIAESVRLRREGASRRQGA